MVQSTVPNLIDLARQGDSEAVNHCLNYVLQKLEVTAKAILKFNVIEIIVEKRDGVPDKEITTKYIENFFNYLNPVSCQQVKIYAQQSGTQQLAWFYEMVLAILTIHETHPATIQVETIPENSHTAGLGITSSTVLAHPPVPQPIPFENLPKSLQYRIKSAGLRPGETRSWQEAQQMYEKMPRTTRYDEKAIDTYKRTHEWSHTKSHANGGSNSPKNGDWENPTLNRARGSQNVTKSEQQAIAQAKAKINFQDGSRIVASQAAMAGGIAFGIEFAFSGLDNFLAVQRGEKSVEEALASTLVNCTGAAVTTAVITGGVMAISLAFPPLGVALGAAAPFLKIVGLAAGMQRLVGILSNSGKVDGIDRVNALLASYGIDDVALDFRDLELDAELSELKTTMKLA